MEQISFQEVVALDADSGVHRTRDGFLAARPRVSRMGIQDYKAHEFGMGGDETIRVNRPENAVFSTDSVATLKNRPITMGHPADGVNSRNWKEHSIGHTGSEVLRDGEFLRVPIIIMDGDAIDAIESGKANEFSLGYTMGLDRAENKKYDFEVRDIRVNHLAVVDRARGGPKLNIKDNETKWRTPMSGNSGEAPLTTVSLDGLTVRTDSAGAEVVRRFVGDTDSKIKSLTEKVDALDMEMKKKKKDEEAKDAEIATLKKSVEDSKLSPAQLDALVQDHQRVVSVGEAMLGKAVVAGKDAAEIRKAVVLHKMGDAAKEWSDEQIKISFDTLAAQTPSPSATPAARSVGDAIAGGFANVGDGREESYKAYDSFLQNAWKNEPEKSGVGGQA